MAMVDGGHKRRWWMVQAMVRDMVDGWKMDFYGGWWTIHGDWLWWMVDGDGGWVMVIMLMGRIQYTIHG
jgi:hypothetical protein